MKRVRVGPHSASSSLLGEEGQDSIQVVATVCAKVG